MNKFVSRSLSILGSSTKEVTKDYMSNITSLVDDAKTIRNQLTQTSTDAADIFAKLKHTNITKKISDWFYTEEQQADSDSGDEFDPGFKIGSSNDEMSSQLDGDDKPRPLTYESMGDITKSQTSTMVKIGRRQTEQSVANTAEIVSALNQRSSEIIAQMGVLNKHFESINSKLDKLVEASSIIANVSVSKSEDEEKDKNSLYDNGKLSLARIFEVAKNNVKDNQVFTFGSMAMDVLKHGPEALVTMGLNALLEKNTDLLGGKSVKGIADRFNNFIGDTLQTAMTEMIGSNVFKKLFNDITSFEDDADYGRFVPNHYTKDRAVFDGMTRTSIIKTIPDLLIEINKNLSGQKFHIDKTGNISNGPRENRFEKIADNLFSSTGLSKGATLRIENSLANSIGQDKVSNDDIDKASKLLSAIIAVDLHTKGTRIFRLSDMKNMEAMTMYINTAVPILCNIKNDPQYWANICQTIFLQLSSGISDSSKFIRNINQNVQEYMREATEFAKNDTQYSDQAKRLTLGDVARRFYQTEIGTSSSSVNGNTGDSSSSSSSNKPKSRDGDIKHEYEGKPSLIGKYTMHDYIRGIFGILNRGINVKTTNKRSNIKGYGNYDLDRITTDQIKEDDKFSGLVMGMITNSSGNDSKDIMNLIRNGINDATKSVLGAEGASALSQASNMSGSFLGNMAGILGAQGIMNMGSRALNGTLVKDVKGFFGKNGKASQYASGIKNKAMGIVNNVTQSRLLNNKHVNDVKDRVVDTFNKGKDVAVKGMNSFKTGARNLRDNIFGAVNDKLYESDSKAFSRSSSRIDNTIIDDAHDMNLVTQIQEYVKKKYYGPALNTAKKINNKKLKARMVSDVTTMLTISKKRTQGELAKMGGRTPSAGSVLKTKVATSAATTAATGSTGIFKTMLNVVKKGFSAVGKVLGKIVKFVAKMATDGLMNITYGFKTMFGGLFGSKQRDADGNVVRDENGKVIRDSGIVRGLTTDLIKLGAQGLKKVGNKVLDAKLPGSSDRSIRDITFTSHTARDENGEIIRDENGRAQRFDSKSIGDLIKEPGKVLGQSLKDIATNISNTKLGSLFKSLGEKIKNAVKTVASAIGSLKNKVKGVGNSKVMQKFKNTAFGSGLTSGFTEARKAKEKLSDAKERASSFINKSVGNIMDAITGAGNKPSALTQISDLIKGFREDMNNNHQEDMEAQKDEVESNDTSSDDSPTIENGADNNNDNNNGSSSSNSGSNDSSSPAPLSERTATSSNGGSPSAGGDSSSGDSGDSSGGTPGKKRGIVGNLLNGLGKIFGGFTQTLLGIFQMVVSIVTAMSGFQALMDTVKSILTDGLKPLNSAFSSITKALKPMIKSLKTIISSIASTVTEIVGSLIKVIQPAMEIMSPIIEDIFGLLKPFLEMFKVFVGLIAVPLLGIIKVLQPIIEGIGYSMQVISGIMQLGFGSILSMLGGIMTGIGAIARFFGAGDGIYKLGKSMTDSGKVLTASGASTAKQGMDQLINLGKNLIKGEYYDEESNIDSNKQISNNDVKVDNVTINPGAMGSGDVTTITNNSYYNTYGSGNTTMNQHSYGNYMNMSERGCGPIALADAYSRRTGRSINPVSLVSGMSGNGSYQPNKGTSVGSFIQMSDAMGMNVRAGGVSQSSLKRATPNNPITLLGSGIDYGTRSGNNHYVNVIGTDNVGGAYVANPLSGRIERRSISTLALNSKLGLYGSGDSVDDNSSFYSLDESTTDALSNLKNLTSKLTGMFTGDSTSETVQKQIEEEDTASRATTIANQVDVETFDEIENTAKEAFFRDNPRPDSETDDEYNARMNKLWSKKEIYNKYIVKYGGEKVVKISNKYYKDLKNAITNTESSIDSVAEGISKDTTGEASSTVNGVGTLKATSGAAMYNFGTPKHTTTNITSGKSGESPVHDFFGVMSNSETFSDTAYDHWFSHGNNPDSTGTGTSGRRHGGVDFSWIDGNNEGKPLYAITGGTVTKADYSESAGYNVQWRDSGGYHHWYMHMMQQPEVKAGDVIQAGQFLGYVGNTGYSSGAHLHYTVKKNSGGSTGDSDVINPLTYFSEYTPIDTLVGSNNSERVWNYLITHGITKEGAAAVMGNMDAESGIQPNNVQDCYEGSVGDDATYTSNVDSGSYTRDRFVNDEAGYGLCQWTVSDRKGPLYDYAKDQKASIGDLATQMNYLVLDEFPRLFSSIYTELQSTTDLNSATERFMRKFENPADQSSSAIQGRINRARNFYDKYYNLTPSTSITPTGQGSTNTGAGLVNSAWDAKILNNVNGIGTSDGINSGTVNTDGGVLNFRSGPSTNNDILDTIQNGYTFDRLEYDGHPGWYKTTYNGNTGYVSGQYILLDKSYTDKIASPDDSLQYISITQPNSAWDAKTMYGNRNNNNSSSSTSTPLSSSSSSSTTSWFGGRVKLSSSGHPYLYPTTSTPVGYPILAFDKADGTYIMTHGTTNKDDIKSFYLYKENPNGNYALDNSFTLGMSDLDAYNVWERYRNVKQSSKLPSPGGYYYSYGSGDTGDFSQIANNPIPPLDMSNFTNNYDTSQQPLQTIINNYEIKSDIDSKRDQFIKKMSSMTFNVRANRVEELLEELIEKVSGDKPTKKTNTSSNTSLFTNNNIPNQILRLSRG